MTQNEINLDNLKRLGILNYVTDFEWMDQYMGSLENEQLGDSFPVFPEREYEWGTREYTASLLISCLFGSKSLNKEIAFSSQSRFNYNLVRWTEL